jgi:DNA transposition AAA+ family ATPase
MTTEQKNKIVDALEQYLTKYEMSANVFVEKTGINEAYISNMRNRSFTVGKTEIRTNWFEAVANKIGFELQKNYWKTQLTNQTTTMLAVLQDAKDFGYTNVIIGETGSGKSYTAQLFADVNPQHLFIVKVGASDNLSDLIDKILDVAKIPTAKTKSKNIGAIVKHFQKLKFEGHKPMIIFDECEYVKQPTLCMMKELVDGLLKYCAIILIGTDELIDKLDRMRKRKKEGIRQFYRRLKFTVRILPSIDTTFKLFLNDIQDKELKGFLQRNCENYGELHDALVPAMREADRTGEPLTESFVRKVLNIPKTMFA